MLNAKSDKMTLKQIYNLEKEKPTPAQLLVTKIADATCREEATVRQWLSGTQSPNAKAKEKISQILGIPVEELFPPSDAESEEPDNDNPIK